MSDLRSWSNLPQEVLNLIRQRLFRRDYSNFRSTCRDWNFRAAFDEAVYDRVDSPLLLGFSRSGTDHDGGSSSSCCCCEAYSPAKEKTYYISAHSKLFDAQIHCSRYGWLLCSRLKHLFFYHPSTQDTIDLPDLGSYLVVPRINRMSFSAPPTSADCVVFCLGDIRSNKEVYVAFIRRGQRSWNLYADGVRNVMKWTGARPRKLVARENGTIRVKSSPCRTNLQHSVGKFWWSNSNCSPVFHNGAFYCLAQDGRLGVLDPKKKMWRILDTFLEEEARTMLYLVECRGKLICIVVGRMGESVRIYRLYEPTKQWQPVANLGDEMIFVGHAGYCNSVMTCNDEELKNTIHFPIFHESHHVFYSLSTQQFHSFEPGHPSIDDLYDTELMLNRAWTIPNFQFLAGSQLRWSSKPKKRPRIAENAAECRGYRIHPHYVIRNLSFSLEHKQSEDDDDDKERREEQEARRPFLTLSNEEGEEMLVDLAKVRPTADHPRSVELAARTRGKQVYSSTAYGVLVLMDVEARRCSLLDLKSMAETTLPTWETPFTCSNAILHSSPGGGSKFTVMVFGEIERQREAESDAEDDEKREMEHDAFAMLWRDGDSEWTVHRHMVKGSKPNVRATIHKGKIYGFPKKRSGMVSIELTPERYTSKPVPKRGSPHKKCPKGSYQLQVTLVECGGELLLFVKFETPGRYGEVMDIQAFKLDSQMMVWEEVEHLGDRAFFWSDLGCYWCRATKFGFKKNSVYYLEWEERNLYRFDYTNRSVTISQPDPVVVDDSWVPGGFIMG
ncbi:unnamed protein product [Linum trigynum]|uniref:KIB1-4 beta-propeller domain-containing protein n=1 Tax=Linum trigynum TaxID=586398 RepID=A0AAV2F213_9ROSI